MSKSAVPPTKDALLKSYQKRLKDDISSIVTNFTEIIKLCKVEEENQVQSCNNRRPGYCGVWISGMYYGSVASYHQRFGIKTLQVFL